ACVDVADQPVNADRGAEPDEAGGRQRLPQAARPAAPPNAPEDEQPHRRHAAPEPRPVMGDERYEVRVDGVERRPIEPDVHQVLRYEHDDRAEDEDRGPGDDHADPGQDDQAYAQPVP